MSMIHGISSRWEVFQQSFLNEQAKASYLGGNFSAVSKMTQGLMGSLILGLGCLLAIEGELDPSSGMMIGGSILMGRAMQPLVQIITQWKSLYSAAQAHKRLSLLVNSQVSQVEAMDLPPPTGSLRVDNVTVAIPKIQTPILMGINFELNQGETLAVMGPSASGKTTLSKVIVGSWPLVSGKVRYDGADISHWEKEKLGPYIGYLPQSIELFEGTLAENIARFGEVDHQKVIEASKWVGLDESISNLPDRYDTQVGIDGSFLSGGMRQRIGLARAIYGLPRIIVLDEPNSSLDLEGEAAFLKTLQYLKQSRCTVVLVTHRSNVMQYVDKIMILVEGRIKAFGPRDEVIASLNAAAKEKRV
jgi:PrtD family type I secretion system ABC transporter